MSSWTRRGGFQSINSQNIDFDDFLILLNVDESVIPSGRRIDHDVDAVSKGSRTLELLRNYCKTAENDKQRLAMLCELINHISSELGAQDVIFCLNDPNVIEGCHNVGSSPDISGVHSLDGRVVNGAWKIYRSGSNIPMWTWPDILIAAEVKPTESTIHLPTDASTTGRNRATKNTPEMALGGNQTTIISLEIVLMGFQEQYYRSLADTFADPEGKAQISMNGRLRNHDVDPLNKESQCQIIRYGVHQLERAHERKYYFALFVVNATLYLAYYDRIGNAHSTKLHLVTDTYRFVLLIKVICGMTRREMGFLDTKELTIVKSPGMRNGFERVLCLCSGQNNLRRKPLRFGQAVSRETLKNGHLLKTFTAEASGPDDDYDGDHLHICRACNTRLPIIELHCNIDDSATRLSIAGPRRTSVSLADCLDFRRDEAYAVKMTWSTEKRHWKRRKLEHAREGWRTSGAAREEHDKVLGNEKLCDCLPRLCKHRNLEELLNIKDFAHTALGKVDYPLKGGDAAIYGLSALSYDYLPVHALQSLCSFQKAIRDVILGHHLLFSHGGLHCNICPDNLMVRIVSNDSIEGVLNDWDLATVDMFSGSYTGASFDRRPFLAIELLSDDAPPRHVERFDWESLFYTIYWICCRYCRGRHAYRYYFTRWCDSDDVTPRTDKRSLLRALSWAYLTPLYEPLFELWTEPLRKLFLAGMTEREKKESDASYIMDDETLNGTITWEKVWDILQK